MIPMAKRELEERKWQETLYNSISLPTKRNGPAFAKFRQEAGATSTPVEKQGTKNTVYSSTGGPTKRKEPWQSGKQGERFVNLISVLLRQFAAVCDLSLPSGGGFVISTVVTNPREVEL